MRSHAPADEQARPRVMLVMPVANEGGSGEALMNLCLGAIALDAWTFEIVCLRRGPLVERLREMALPVHELDIGRLGKPWTAARAIAALVRIGRRMQADLVYAVEPAAHLVSGPAARMLGIPALWQVPGRPDPGGRIDRAAARIPAAAIIAVSTFVADEQRSLTPKARIDVVHPGIDTSRFRPPSTRDPGPLRVGIVGRLVPWKRQDDFLEAAALVATQHDDVEFWIVGGSDPDEGPYVSSLHRRSRDLGLSDRVRWTGHLREVSTTFAQLDIAVHLSESEPFGLVLVEAMAMALPLISVRSGGPLEIVDDGRTGLLVDLGDTTAVAAAIGELLSDPVRRRQIGTAARASACARFDLSEVARGHERSFARVLGRPGLRPR